MQANFGMWIVLLTQLLLLQGTHVVGKPILISIKFLFSILLGNTSKNAVNVLNSNAILICLYSVTCDISGRRSSRNR